MGLTTWPVLPEFYPNWNIYMYVYPLYRENPNTSLFFPQPPLHSLLSSLFLSLYLPCRWCCFFFFLSLSPTIPRSCLIFPLDFVILHHSLYLMLSPPFEISKGREVTWKGREVTDLDPEHLSCPFGTVLDPPALRSHLPSLSDFSFMLYIPIFCVPITRSCVNWCFFCLMSGSDAVLVLRPLKYWIWYLLFDLFFYFCLFDARSLCRLHQENRKFFNWGKMEFFWVVQGLESKASPLGIQIQLLDGFMKLVF